MVKLDYAAYNIMTVAELSASMHHSMADI